MWISSAASAEVVCNSRSSHVLEVESPHTKIALAFFWKKRGPSGNFQKNQSWCGQFRSCHKQQIEICGVAVVVFLCDSHRPPPLQRKSRGCVPQSLEGLLLTADIFRMCGMSHARGRKKKHRKGGSRTKSEWGVGSFVETFTFFLSGGMSGQTRIPLRPPLFPFFSMMTYLRLTWVRWSLSLSRRRKEGSAGHERAIVIKTSCL